MISIFYLKKTYIYKGVESFSGKISIVFFLNFESLFFISKNEYDDFTLLYIIPLQLMF